MLTAHKQQHPLFRATFFSCLVLAVVFCLAGSAQSAGNDLTTRLKGRLLLQVEDHGRVWYVDPVGLERHEVTFANALNLFESLSLGVTNADLRKIPLNPDSFDDTTDTDNDGFTDKSEATYGYNPEMASDPDNRGNDKLIFDAALASRLQGRLLLQVEDRGRVWYVDTEGQRWEVTWDNLMNLFRRLALGITNADLEEVEASEISASNVREYVNEELGIRFIYPDTYEGQKVNVKAIGNKVFVYHLEPIEDGQSVEIFDRNPNDTLKISIEKQFNLDDLPNCWITESNDVQGSIGGNQYGSLTINALTFPHSGDGPWFDNQGYCPAGYGKTNGFRYFYSWPGSNKFAFLDIGQYGIPVYGGPYWQDSIEFLDFSADWQIYTNSDYNYEIKYPAGFQVFADYGTLDQIFIGQDGTNRSPIDGVMIKVHQMDDYQAYLDLINKIKDRDELTSVLEESTLEDHPALLIGKTKLMVAKLVLTSAIGYNDVHYFINADINGNSFVVEIIGDNDNQMQQEIISTFKKTN